MIYTSPGTTVDEYYIAILHEEQQFIYGFLRTIVDGTMIVSSPETLEHIRHELNRWLDIQNLYTTNDLPQAAPGPSS